MVTCTQLSPASSSSDDVIATSDLLYGAGLNISQLHVQSGTEADDAFDDGIVGHAPLPPKKRMTKVLRIHRV